MALCIHCLKPGCDSKECLLNKYLFVYGTLKKGRGNDRLLDAATFIGPAVSVGSNFVMDGIRVNEAEPRERGAPIKGELYLVSTIKEWLRLDRLESHPHVYRRKVRAFVAENGKQYDAWIYMFEPDYWSKRERTRGIPFNAEYLNDEGQLEL